MTGTCRRSEPDERSRRRDDMSATRVKQDWKLTVINVNQNLLSSYVSYVTPTSTA